MNMGIRWLTILSCILVFPEIITCVCPPGTVGDNCENVLCDKYYEPISHFGTDNYGELIFLDTSEACDEFKLDLDGYLEDIFIWISFTDSKANPQLEMHSVDEGRVIDSCDDNAISDKERLQKYCNPNHSLRGSYIVKVKSDTQGSCVLQVRGQTLLVADGGFVADPHDDHLQYFSKILPNEGISKFPEADIPAYFAFAVKDEIFPTQPLSVNFYRGNELQHHSVLKTRYGCGFPHITNDSFTCSDTTSTYYAQIIGIESNGYKWNRIYKFGCESLTTPPPTASDTPPVILECFNNGTLVDNVCECTKYFEGNNCEWPNCLNGGTLNQGNEQCYCAIGYSGTHCETVKCTEQSTDTFEDNFKILAFVIRSSRSMASQISQILQAANLISNLYETEYPNYINQYVLTIVSKQDVQSSEIYYNSNNFVQAIQNITFPDDDDGCDDALFAGIEQTLDNPAFLKYQNSPIFVFTDGTASDSLISEQYVLQQSSDTRAQIFFILSESSSENCFIRITDNQYLSMFTLAGFTQGLAIKTDSNSLANTTYSIASILYRSSSIISNDFPDCHSKSTIDSFYIDASATSFYIAATGDKLSLTVRTPEGIIAQPRLAYQSGSFYLWYNNAPTPGAYLINMTNAGETVSECSYRIFTTSSKYYLYFGSSTEMNMDRYSKQPIVGKSSHIVAKLTNFWIPDVTDIESEADLWYNDQNGNRVTLYKSDGLYRDECIYNLYFGAFECSKAFQHFYMKISVFDPEGDKIQRTVTGYCKTTIPPPPGETCLNGGKTFNGTCVCPSHFTGKKCQNVLCENQGTQIPGGCVCPPGFSGQFCETVACTTYNQYVNPSNNHKSFSLLMHDSLTTRSVMRLVNDAASRVLHDIQVQYPRWFDSYQLLRFNDTAYEVRYDGSNPQLFLQELDHEYMYNVNHSDISCKNLDVYSTIANVLLREKISWGGIIYMYIYGTAKEDEISYNKIINHIEENKIQINIIQLSLMPCGQDFTSDGLMNLVELSGGTYYIVNQMNAGKAFSTLPTKYSSGIVYERTSSNCQNTTFYVPIDSQTQSFNVYIQGELKNDITYTSPNGETEQDLYINNIWKDVIVDTHMDRINRRCDDGWNYEDKHCWKIGYKMSTWAEARQDCANNQATLATIYNNEEQNSINRFSEGVSVWIGLNDLKELYQWTWDVPNNVTLTLSDTKYENWAPGQSSNPSNRCVLDSHKDASRGWIPADCTEKHLYLCTKSPYNADYEPSNIEENALLNGIWQITVNAYGSCSITVTSQSSIQVLNSFTTDIHNDFGEFEPIQGSNNNRLISMVTGISNPNQRNLQYAHVYSDNGELVQVETIQMRSNCHFSFISTPFMCIDNTFQMYLTGMDDMGSLFQRIIPVTCQGGLNPNSCENDGIYYDGKCVCSPGYTGEHCELALCENGFPNADLGICTCYEGWSGLTCNIPICMRNEPGPIYTNDQKSFILAIDGCSNGDMGDVIAKLDKILTDVLQNVNFSHSSWFKNFIGIVFYDADSINSNIPPVSPVVSANNYTAFIDNIQKQAQSIKYDSKRNTRSIFKALNSVLSHSAVVPNSPLYILTSSGADDTIYAGLLEKTISYSHAAIYEIFIGDNTAPGGGSYTENGVNVLLEAAHESGGSVYQVPRTQLQSFWKNQMNLLYSAFSISSHHISNCAHYTEYIQLGSNAKDLVIDIFGGEPIVTVYTPDGNSQIVTASFTSKTNVLVHLPKSISQTGIWSVSLKSSSPTNTNCMFNIRSQSYGTNELLVYTSFTQDVESDGGLHDSGSVSYPIANGMKNAVVASSSSGSRIAYAQIYDIEERSLLWSSRMIARKGCIYSYISTDTFVCEQSTFLLSIDGFDEVGYPFRRLFTYHCQGNIPKPSDTTTPPVVTTTSIIPTIAPSCAVNQPKADIIIAIDSSRTFDVVSYKQTIEAFRQLSDYFLIGENNVRIVVGTYDTVQSFDDQLLTNIKNAKDYMNHLDTLRDYGHTGIDGNNIDSVLEYVSAMTSESSFRENVRKVVVLISSLGWDKGNIVNNEEQGFPNPSSDMATLKEMGVEFIPIGWGYEANLKQLSAFSNKCLKIANNMGDMNRAIHFISRTLCNLEPEC